MLNLLIFAAACGMSGCSGEATSNSTRDKSMPPAELPSHHGSTEILVGPVQSKDAVAAPAPTNPAAPIEPDTLTAADLARSSWENPFRPRLWSCEGWRVDENSMTCESAAMSPATFLRPYRNVVIECQLSRPAEATTSSATESPTPFELRLLNQSTGNWIGVVVDADNVSLSEFSDDQQPALQTLRKTSRQPGSENHEIAVRLTITPNRILVAINSRLKINAARPSSTMNVECLPQFVAHEAGVTLSDLRIEGD